MLHRLGLRWYKENRTDDAVMVFHDAKKIHDRAGSLITQAGMSLINDMCVATVKRNDSSTAECYQLFADTISQATEAERHAITAEAIERNDPIQALKRLSMKAPMGGPEELEYIRLMVSLCRLLGLQSFGCAENLISLGAIESRVWPSDPPLSEIDKTLALYAEAQGILEKIGSTSKPAYAYLIHNVGVCLGQKNDRMGEARAHKDAVDLLDQIGHNSNNMYAHVLYDLVNVQFGLGEDEVAQRNLEKANAIYDNNPKFRSQQRAGSLRDIGNKRFEAGAFEEALVLFQLANDVHDQMGTSQTDGGKEVALSLENVRKRVGPNKIVPLHKIVTFDSEYLQLRRTRPSTTR